MHAVTLRLPERVANLLFESDAVEEAGYRVHPHYNPKGMPVSSWVTFRVECPEPMQPREAVSRLARICP